jgi:phage baseplate assembly protein W
MAIYQDLDFNLNADEYGNVNVLEDKDAIQQSLKNIIFTRIGSRTKFHNPNFGSNLNKLLFEKMNRATELEIEDEIRFSIENFEPRVKIVDIVIDAKYDQYQYDISIIYNIVNLSEADELNVTLDVVN